VVHGRRQAVNPEKTGTKALLFYEYFHGDNGAGLGASHQTDWTGIVARMMHLFATTTVEDVVAIGKEAVHHASASA
jgi:hypothetical protein